VRQKGFAPIIILLAIGGLGLLVYFGAFYKSPSQTSFQEPSSSSPVPTTSASPDPTENWKTYTDEVGEFLFRYPNDWGILDVGGALMLAPLPDVEKVSEMAKGGGFGGGKFLISLINIYEVEPSLISSEYSTVVKSTVEIDGKTAYLYESTQLLEAPGASKGDIHTSIVIPLKNRYFYYSLLDEVYKQTFDQILSTFKFTE